MSQYRRHSLHSRQVLRRRIGAWAALAAMTLTLMAGSFGNLPLPAPGEAGGPFALVICTTDGLVSLVTGQDGPAEDGRGHGLCLLCLPLFVDGPAALTFLVLILIGRLVGRPAGTPPTAVLAGPVCGFGTVRDARGPPLARPA